MNTLITNQVLQLLPTTFQEINHDLDIWNDMDDRDEFVNMLGESILNKLGYSIDEELLENIFELVGDYCNCIVGRIL